MNVRVSNGDAIDVLIVGAGVISLAIADTLAGEGLSVRVVEAEAVGSGASGAAAGMLAPISEADLDSPLLPLGLASLQCFEPLCTRLREETGIDPEYVRSGLLHVARAGAETEALRARCHRIQEASSKASWVVAPDLEWIEGETLKDFEAALDPVWAGGFFSPHEAHLRPPLLVRALAASAERRGVRIDSGIRANRLVCEGNVVVGIDSSAGPIAAGATILAAGAWTSSLLASSDRAPVVPAILPVRGQILSLDAPLPPMKSICWSSDVYFVPKRDGSWIVGATEEHVGFDRRVTAEGVAWLLDRAREVFPDLADASFGRVWAGLRPVSADGLPSIGRVSDREGLWIAAGHGRNGVLLAPITARLISDDLLEKVPHAEPGPFAPIRS